MFAGILIVEEIWKWIPDYENMYMVPNLGRVKSVKRFVRRGNNGVSFTNDKILKIITDSKGYSRVTLCCGVMKLFNIKASPYVHNLVLSTFIGPCPKGMECRHFPDRDPSNNRLDNLSWGTPVENAIDRVWHGTQPYKLPLEQRQDIIYQYIRKRVPAKILADKYNVSVNHIYGLSQQARKNAHTIQD